MRGFPSLRTLAANGWIDATVEGTTLKIRLGEHAKKVREGKEDAKAGGGTEEGLTEKARRGTEAISTDGAEPASSVAPLEESLH